MAISIPSTISMALGITTAIGAVHNTIEIYHQYSSIDIISTPQVIVIVALMLMLQLTT